MGWTGHSKEYSGGELCVCRWQWVRAGEISLLLTLHLDPYAWSARMVGRNSWSYWGVEPGTGYLLCNYIGTVMKLLDTDLFSCRDGSLEAEFDLEGIGYHIYDCSGCTAHVTLG